MEQLLHLFSQLADIIVRAVPAFIIFVLLHLYLKRVLFQPLERVLEERRKKTQGAVDASEAIVRQAESKLDSYERALNQARADIYKEQEVARHTLAARQAAALEEARARVGQQIAAARNDLNAEVEQARATLSTEADRLAETIVAGVLAGRN
ncbi:MAG TPA: ATP synthase F0 subunit B [Bryobacteraceae bacterium]|nr:ATP synthase F0 subunit B [Bryobacteraceae bacterium]HPT27851.1 ATP synthase F0 subunit B [Bryobacteraceae bacterium]